MSCERGNRRRRSYRADGAERSGPVVAAGLLVLVTLTGCFGGGPTGETSPVPVRSTARTQPTTPQDVVDETVLPKSEFPASYRARQRVDRSLEVGTNTLCGYDETDEKRVARVQVYSSTETEEAIASNEVVAYPDAATAKRALRFLQRLVRFCHSDDQERNGIDDLRKVKCLDGILADAVCLRFQFVDDTGETLPTYKIVQVRDNVLSSTYVAAPKVTEAIPLAEALAKESAVRMREAVEP